MRLNNEIRPDTASTGRDERAIVIPQLSLSNRWLAGRTKPALVSFSWGGDTRGRYR